MDLVTAQEHIRKRAADDVAVRVYERVGKDRVGRGRSAAHQCDVVVEIVQAGLLHTGSGDRLAVVEGKSVDGVQNLLRGLGQAELPSLLRVRLADIDIVQSVPLVHTGGVAHRYTNRLSGLCLLGLPRQRVRCHFVLPCFLCVADRSG